MQVALPLPPPKRTHGGAREGAGRPKLVGGHDSPHRAREKVTRHTPVHVVLRTVREVGRLRRGAVRGALRGALAHVQARAAIRIVHVSIQRNHIHLIVEAVDARVLARGMQGFAICAARAINRVQRRSGKVFAFRYHATTLRSPRQTRNALAYVLNNWRRRREHESSARARGALVDPYASGVAFSGWEGRRVIEPLPELPPLPVAAAKSWLLVDGWRRHGAIRFREVPGPLLG